MLSELLTSEQAARRLGISVTTFRGWLAQSDRGQFVICGQPVTILYLQGGPKGEGRIKIESGEVERLKEAMKVRPRPVRQRRPPTMQQHYPGIHVELGSPAELE